MAVVKNSEDIRLQQAKEQYEELARKKEESEELKKQIFEFNTFMEGQKTIRTMRWKSIKDRASEWSGAHTQRFCRHLF